MKRLYTEYIDRMKLYDPTRMWDDPDPTYNTETHSRVEFLLLEFVKELGFSEITELYERLTFYYRGRN